MSPKVAVLQDVMTSNVITASPSTSVESVRFLMLQYRISRVVLVNRWSIPVGILTDKDILRYTLDRDSKKLDQVLALSVMSKPLVRLPETTPVTDCAKRMLESGISSVVVVRGEAVVGIVTKTDLCMFYSMSGAGGNEVRNWMTTNPITVKASLELVEAARLMSEKNISRLLVVNGSLKGIVTASDLTAVNPSLSPSVLRARPSDLLMLERAFAPRDAGAKIVADIMTRNPITVLDRTLLTEAAKLMIIHHFGGLPVLNQAKELVGIVTKTDIARAIVNKR